MAKRETQFSRAPTRKQIARSRKEREQIRTVYMGLGLVAALVIIVLAVGLIQTFVIEPNSPVAIVNDEEITTRDYQTRVRYERFGLEDQYQQILSEQASLAESEDEQLAQLLTNQYTQLANRTLQQLSVIDRQAVEQMIDDELIKAEAAKRGITVSDEEITEFINRSLAGRLGGLTAAAASETTTARADASATAALWTPTPTFTPSPTLTTTGEITQPTVTPANTPAPPPTPTLNVIDENALSTQYADWLNVLAENAGIDEATYRQIIRSLVLRDKLQRALGAEVPKFAEQSHARHILVETEDEANEVIKRLNAGEDFADLASELSTDPGSAANGGDLGFVPKGRFVESVDEAVFTIPIGKISEPIESDFGWHIIEVLEREERELSPVEYNRSQQLANDEWLANTREAAKIENYWTVDKAPEASFLQQQIQLSQQAPPGSQGGP